jgi:hypothetical protein
LDADVGRIEVSRIDVPVVVFPRETGFIGSTRIEWRHIGLQTGDDLHKSKALHETIGGKCLEIVGPAQPFAKSHPPRIAQPEEGRAIHVLEMPVIGSHANGAVAIEWVLPVVGAYLQRAG